MAIKDIDLLPETLQPEYAAPLDTMKVPSPRSVLRTRREPTLQELEIYYLGRLQQEQRKIEIMRPLSTAADA